MKHTSIFIVRSPLQLFNCVEASKRYDCGAKILVILFRKEVDRKLMEQVVQGGDVVWDRVVLGDIRSNLKQIALLADLLRSASTIRYCFIGDTTHILNIYVNSIVPEKVVLVDDGASTYRRAMTVVTRSFEKLNRHQQPIHPLLRFTDRVLRLGPAYLARASFFTMYRRIQEYSPDLEVVHNDYRFFRQRVAQLPVRDEILFIGCDIRRYVLKQQERFEFYLAAAAKYYRGRDWTYVLHRKENESPAQRALMEDYGRKYGFRVVIYDMILEQQILHQGWRPAEVATFYSSAIDTLQAIYSPRTTVFELRNEDLLDVSKFELAEMLKHYREMEMNIVTV